MSTRGNVKPDPAPYDLNDPDEVIRLYRECWGYLHTCRAEHHGTDFKGRDFAMAALQEMMGRAQLTLTSAYQDK